MPTPRCGACGRLVTDGRHPGCFTTGPLDPGPRCRTEWTTLARTLADFRIWHACDRPAGHAGPHACEHHYDGTACDGPSRIEHTQ